uniref:Ribonuclease H-like domain-containing protein n=1 Tax=Tanacetum cinerariifolium TaxID=118510 RepID=A0A6L2K5Z1_TANCI|nr:ribonuclease H-like domain-containing protein [Tanacetum cinerariifolium]
MTDYSLWEVILNGDSPAPTRVIDGVLQHVAPTTVEHRLARKNKLKARGTLLMALPDKHQLKFNTHKDAKTLMEEIEKRLQNLISQLEILRVSLSQEDINLNLKIYEAEVKSSSSTSTSTQNIAFVSSFNTNNTTEPISTATSVSAINVDDLKEMDLKWKIDMLIVECYNCHRKGYFARECRSPKDTRRNGSYDWSFQAEEEQNESVFEEDIKLLKLEVQLRDNALVVLRKNLKKAEHERDDLKLKLEKFQTSFKNLSELLASQTNDKTGNGYHAIPPPYTGTFMPPKPELVFNNAPNDVETIHPAFNVELSLTKLDNDLSHTHRPSAPIIEEWVSETKIPHNVPSFVQPTEQVKSPRPSDQHTKTRQDKPIVTKLASPPRRHINHSPSPKASNFSLKVTAVKAPIVNAAQGVQGKWEWKPKFPVLDHGNPQHALKDKGVIDSGCSWHMTWTMSYLFDFKELNGGYVAFGGNPKGGKISRKGKIKTGKLDFDDVYFVKELKFNLFSVSQMRDKKNCVLFTDTECFVLSPEFKLPDDNQVLLRVPRENNMYNIDLKNIVSFGDLTCLFAKATIDESNLWHRRLGHINFKTLNKLVKGNLVKGLPTKVSKNDQTCVACKKGKQHRASYKKSASTPIDTEKPLLKDPDDSDYAGASLDRKSTTRGCQFLGCRLIFWQCKKQTVMATLSTEAEYVVALSGMESLKKMLHVTNILSAGYLTTPQIVLNSPCLIHIKN